MFDPQEEVLKLQAQTKLIRKRPYRQRSSKLDRYKFELLSLHKNGATTAELKRWLKSHSMTVEHSTISRWLNKYG